MGRARLLVGISLFWLGLSVLSDGMATLVLPQHLAQFAPEATRATTLGLLSFVGILAGMLLQPLAGSWSDRLRPRWGRRGALILGALLILLALAAFALSRGVL